MEKVAVTEEQCSRKREEYYAEIEPVESNKTRLSLVDEFKVEDTDAHTFCEIYQVLAGDMSHIKHGDGDASFLMESFDDYCYRDYYVYSPVGPTFVSTDGYGKEEESCGACFSDWWPTVRANLDMRGR
ncbi:uncharacterized protein A4U43_C08F4830 [Asparagus officinalis]|nr:uncharacterized protein A4U43_C08F4830 [Asparagus officinalis]